MYLVNFVLGLAARARTCGRVTSGTRLGPLGNVHPSETPQTQTRLHIQSRKPRQIQVQKHHSRHSQRSLQNPLRNPPRHYRVRQMDNTQKPPVKMEPSPRSTRRLHLLTILDRKTTGINPIQNTTGSTEMHRSPKRTRHYTNKSNTNQEKIHPGILHHPRSTKTSRKLPGMAQSPKTASRKHNLQPKTPMLRRLLELAENLPLAKKPRKRASPR